MVKCNLGKRFYEKNVLEGCKEIFEKLKTVTSITGGYIIHQDHLVLPEILWVLLKSGNDLDISLLDRGNCPTGCVIIVFNKKHNKEGEIVKISFDGPPNNRFEEAEDYKRQIIEAKNSLECESILNKLNEMF